MELIVILDGTWQSYNIHQFASYLSETLDVSFYGSKVGFIDGESGAWLTNVTSDLLELHKDLSAKTAWPARLSLTRCLHTIIGYYQEDDDTDPRPYGSVVLIMGQTTTLGDVDMVESLESLYSLRRIRPEVKFIFVADEGFKRLKRRGDVILQPQKSISDVLATIRNELLGHPAGIINFFGNRSSNEFEDYLTPGRKKYYQIRGEYLVAASVSVKFKGNGYGDVSICAYDEKSVVDRTCKGITVNSEVTFNIKDHCSGEPPCTVRFEAFSTDSSFKCAG
ncbi:PREDICTED: uncharacterized protein LOC108569860 isoform X2 [Nicrophorus vespilloides]|uniref:Uncharacterized protein LOC108569860 isoform X2 n=1 Tax=Nicrophorus vespilloides TaxID=110193 RepID=A0ABM1NJQ8_NICVS|nr:PREDICTED: uncharacterized protein LOC108569860 isoform X2 [Nicrophorus vespilloides]